MNAIADGPIEGRNARRKERTRAALIGAAQDMLIDGSAPDASIQAITDRADVGFGSFSNHFASKTELFETALELAGKRHQDWLDARLESVTDPVRRLAVSIRLTGRLHLSHPTEAGLLLTQFSFLGTRPLAARVHDDVVAAIETMPANARTASRSDVTVISAMGAIAAVLNQAENEPKDGIAALADALVADVLRLLGVEDSLISELVSEPLD